MWSWQPRAHTHVVREAVDVHVSPAEAYQWWQRCELFPVFSNEVLEVIRIDDVTTHWDVRLGTLCRSFDVELTNVTENECLGWRSIRGVRHTGEVFFHPVDGHVRVQVELCVQPGTLSERLAVWTHLIDHRVRAALQRFRTFAESEERQETPRPALRLPRQPQRRLAPRGGTSPSSVPPTGAGDPSGS